MLEISKKPDTKDRKKFEIYLNGENLPVGNIPEEIRVIETENGFEVTIFDLDISDKFKSLTVKELNIIKRLDLLWGFSNDFRLYIDINFIRSKDSLVNKEINASLKFGIYPNLNSWKRKYSFEEYQKEFFKHLNKEKNPILDYKSNQNALNFDLSATHTFSDLSLQDELEKYEYIIFECLKYTETILESESVDNLIQSTFDFPKEIKFSCEQYLLYFAQFLQDLGINATSNLKEEAGKVLFSVTPTDDVEALDKIREALAVYLNLPTSPISDLEYSENFALMRLQQQVRNLQHSQQMAKTELLSAQYALSLAQQNIENQDQIIVRQHSTIENLNKVIEKITSPSIMTDSLEKKDKEEFEEICEGLRVGESKWLRELTGVGLSTGKFVKAIVKNTFGKEEKNSVLGLDED